MSGSRAGASPGYTRPLSNAQKEALQIIDINGDIHRPFTGVRVNTIESLLQLGLVEHREIAEGIGADGVSRSRHAIVLSRLAEIMRYQWSPGLLSKTERQESMRRLRERDVAELMRAKGAKGEGR